MDENQRDLRRAQIAELQIALETALRELEKLEKRLAARKNVDGAGAELSNRLANQVALGMTKAGVVPKKP